MQRGFIGRDYSQMSHYFLSEFDEENNVLPDFQERQEILITETSLQRTIADFGRKRFRRTPADFVINFREFYKPSRLEIPMKNDHEIYLKYFEYFISAWSKQDTIY